MYLSKLSKEQKKLFLELCTSLSIIDRDFKEEEKKSYWSIVWGNEN